MPMHQCPLKIVEVVVKVVYGAGLVIYIYVYIKVERKTSLSWRLYCFTISHGIYQILTNPPDIWI